MNLAALFAALVLLPLLESLGAILLGLAGLVVFAQAFGEVTT